MSWSKRITGFAGAACAVSALAGCATTQTPTEAAIPAVSVYPGAQMSPGRGVVSVIRDRGMMGMACKVYLLMDGVEIAFIEPGHRVEFGADPGERILTADTRGICGGGTANIALDVRADRVSYVRVGANQSGDLRVDPAPPGFR